MFGSPAAESKATAVSQAGEAIGSGLVRKSRATSAAFFGAFTLMRILAFTGFCRFTARPISCEASINSREKMGWKMRERSGGSRDMSRSALS